MRRFAMPEPLSSKGKVNTFEAGKGARCGGQALHGGSAVLRDGTPDQFSGGVGVAIEGSFRYFVQNSSTASRNFSVQSGSLHNA